MLAYFDHTFFKIVSSFVGILAMSLALFALAGQYHQGQQGMSPDGDAQWDAQQVAK